MCVRDIEFESVTMIFLSDFRIVSTVHVCFVFHFISYVLISSINNKTTVLVSLPLFNHYTLSLNVCVCVCVCVEWTMFKSRIVICSYLSTTNQKTTNTVCIIAYFINTKAISNTYYFTLVNISLFIFTTLSLK